jgi:anoctamin-8
MPPFPGTIDNYFPLHENTILNSFHQNWWDYLIPAHKIEEVRDYFGENIALYWKWVGFLMMSLTILAAAGTLSMLADLFEMTPNNFTTTPYAIFAGFFATFLMHFWRRSSAHQLLKWGALDLEAALEPPRKEFRGEKRINPVTDKPELHYDWKNRIGAYLCSFSVLAGCLLGLLAVTVLLFIARHIAHKEYKDPNAPLYFQFFNACLVEFLNSAFSGIAKQLTDAENHRTLREYQSHLLAKSFVFKFFNSYVSLYFIAFFKGHDTQIGPFFMPRCAAKTMTA